MHMQTTSWIEVKKYQDIRFHKTEEGIGKVSINRPEVHNAFRPETVLEMMDAFEICRNDTSIGVIILTGEGGKAFCSGGDQRMRSGDGYVDQDGSAGLHVLDLQKQIRSLPKPVIAMVRVCHRRRPCAPCVCDLTIAAENARFGQVRT